MSTISAVIITHNEEKHIGRCIDSLSVVADEVIVLDSFSTDNTVAIAQQKGALVYQQPFAGYIQQKNRAIMLASYNYILLLDADEALSKDLSVSILVEKQTGFGSRAYQMKRCNIFCGKPVKHGLWYPDKKLRLFDKRIAYCGGLNPHDRIILTEKLPVQRLDGDLLHYTHNNVKEYVKRNREVSSIAAQSVWNNGGRPHWSKILLSPLWAFINGYIFKLGFLDGRTGWIIAVNTTKQTFQKYYKLKLLQQQQPANGNLQQLKTDLSS